MLKCAKIPPAGDRVVRSVELEEVQLPRLDGAELARTAWLPEVDLGHLRIAGQLGVPGEIGEADVPLSLPDHP
jgi:hypothetical protein